MSENSMYHSIVREEIKSQCGTCGAHNGYHAIYCPEIDMYGGR